MAGRARLRAERGGDRGVHRVRESQYAVTPATVAAPTMHAHTMATTTPGDRPSAGALTVMGGESSALSRPAAFVAYTRTK